MGKGDYRHKTDRVKTWKSGGRQPGDVDWTHPDRIERLDLLLKRGATATDIAQTFGDCTRSGVIGAVARLREKKLLKWGFKGVPTGASKKVKVKTQPIKEVAQQGPSRAVTRLDHNGNPETRIEREWVTHPSLKLFNAKRMHEAKNILECKGCRFPVNDEPPWLFCSAKTDGSSVYCPTHAHWASSKAFVQTPSKGTIYKMGQPNLKR